MTTGPNANARLLDDEWLARLVEVGVAGLLGWIWLIVRFVRRSARAAKNDFTQRGWLLVALVCSVVSFAGGMFLFDAFSFVQVSFVFFILLALGSVTFLQTAPVEQKMSAV